MSRHSDFKSFTNKLLLRIKAKKLHYSKNELSRINKSASSIIKNLSDFERTASM